MKEQDRVQSLVYTDHSRLKPSKPFQKAQAWNIPLRSQRISEGFFFLVLALPYTQTFKCAVCVIFKYLTIIVITEIHWHNHRKQSQIIVEMISSL